MALDPDRLQTLARANEEKAKKRFEKMAYHVEVLDDGKVHRMPEFLVSDSAGPLLVAEVKTLFSAGYLEQEGVHVSTEDPELLEQAGYRIAIDFSAMDDDLRDATAKYERLLGLRPQLVETPLVVVFYLDPLADRFDLYPENMKPFPVVSGILKVEVDYAIKKAAQSMSLDALAAAIDSGSLRGFPPRSLEFRVLQNECATNPLPQHFVDRCLTG